MAWHAVCYDRTAGQARAELSAAMTLYRSMDMTLWIPRVETALTRTSTMS